MFIASMVLLPLALTPAPKPVVMVLGTYHFANPGLDLVKSQIRDTLGSERQREIADLVNRLKKFKPTKVMIEAVPSNQATIDGWYKEFIAGTYTLRANEIDQIGFRVAKEMGLRSVLCVDSKLGMDFNGTFGFAMQNGQGDLVQKVTKTVEKVGALMEEMDRKYTVPQLLAIHNSPEFVLQSQSFYVELTKIAANEKFPGADMVGDWYKRNLRIFANIEKNIEPGDRVLVIYGSGHAYYLNQTIQASMNLTFESPMKYLPKPPLTKLAMKF